MAKCLHAQIAEGQEGLVVGFSSAKTAQSVADQVGLLKLKILFSSMVLSIHDQEEHPESEKFQLFVEDDDDTSPFLTMAALTALNSDPFIGGMSSAAILDDREKSSEDNQPVAEPEEPKQEETPVEAEPQTFTPVESDTTKNEPDSSPSYDSPSDSNSSSDSGSSDSGSSDGE